MCIYIYTYVATPQKDIVERFSNWKKYREHTIELSFFFYFVAIQGEATS